MLGLFGQRWVLRALFTQLGVTMKRLTLFGATFSILWLLGALFLVLRQLKAPDPLPLNAWGDFVAGAIAPLGFFWLVLGYFQNTHALRSQQIALQKQLQHAYRQTLLADVSAQVDRGNATDAVDSEESHALVSGALRFEVLNYFYLDGLLGITLLTCGARATDIRVRTDAEVRISLQPNNFLEDGERATLFFVDPSDFPIHFHMRYRDSETRLRVQHFTLIDKVTLAAH